MPKSYSTDMRWHVVWLHVFLKKSIDEVATLLFISSTTVHRYVAKFLKANDAVVKATTIPETIIHMAFCSVTKENCSAYIHHAGYQ